MSRESIPISVEYIITTTSDWTRFQIIEGGWWSALQVECTQGFDKLEHEIVYSEKTIHISKKPYDDSKVVVNVKCTLNIIKEYLQSNITYLIAKGDIESTVVRVIAEGKEILSPLVNGDNVPNNPINPLPFESPVKYYLQALQEKRKVEKATEKPKEKIEPEEVHIIVKTYNEMFKEVFKKREPTEKDIEAIFEWVQSHGENATKYLEADIYRDLTLKAETYFWRFPNLKKKVKKEADNTLKKIRKRYDALRTIQGKFALQTPYVGIEKEEKKVAPNK